MRAAPGPDGDPVCDPILQVGCALASALVFALAACGAEPGSDSPTSTDAASPSAQAAQPAVWEALSEEGLYRVSLRPREGRPRTGPLHAWVVHVERADGEPVEPTRLTVGGGMPQHGHGFVTVPRVTRSLGDGDYLIEGVRFHMPGEWTFQIGVVAPAGTDSAAIVVPVAP